MLMAVTKVVQLYNYGFNSSRVTEADVGGHGGQPGTFAALGEEEEEGGLPQIDEWGEIVVLDDEMVTSAAAEPVSPSAEFALQHVREAESRAFHDEHVGRPAFGYEQLDRGDDTRRTGSGTEFEEESTD